MAKINKLDITDFYDFGRANAPSDPNLSHRMYFDYLSEEGSNKLMITDGDFNILSSYQAFPGSLIVIDNPPAIIDKLDICVLNDQGLNSFPPRANQTNPIYRMYFAERAIVVKVPTLVTQINLDYINGTGSFEVGETITNGSGASGIVNSSTANPNPATGTLTVYVTEGTFVIGDTITSEGVSAEISKVTTVGTLIIYVETNYDYSLLIVNQKFEIEFIIPLLEGFIPLESLSVGAICCSYDYGFNAQGNNQNYIWHMYVGDYTIDPGTEFETIVPRCLLIVNEDFKVVSYQTPLP